jgi:LmbE family N-acetylglucosaminyl deacetylase
MNGETMGRVFFYAPHPDDDVLSMGLAMLHYIANGIDVHLVSVTPGDALGVANTLNGSANGTPITCTNATDHPYIHNPDREGFPTFTTEMVGQARAIEARSTLGAMAMVPLVAGVTPGTVTHHVETLHDGFGANGSGSSTAPVTPEGIAAAKEVIKRYVDEYPNSFHYTMSQTDDHHDHAACGFALRQLKDDATNKVPWADITYAQALANARFFVSKLYWENNYAKGADVLTMPGLSWFNYYGANYDRYCAWLRNQVIKTYHAWNPAAGSYAIGYHSVVAQFNNCFGAGVNIANLWHA